MTECVRHQLGNYRLLRSLGQGSFAEVYLGEHIHLKSFAAIKILSTRLTHESHGNFLREAQILARLNHPHIIRVLDFGIERDTPFLVMDYAPHGTLHDRHPLGMQLPLTAVIDYVDQIADALQYAHDQNLIHRDLKPENLLIGPRNELLLSDFGIAVIARATAGTGASEHVIGTACYMAPEQIQGKPVFASDQYALAVMVYEWLSGRLPFQGTFLELCSQHLAASPPPLSELVPTLPSAVATVVHAALAKEPNSRYACVKEFAVALKQAFQTGHLPVSSHGVVVTPRNLQVAASGIDQDFAEEATLPVEVVRASRPIIAPVFNIATHPSQASAYSITQQSGPFHNDVTYPQGFYPPVEQPQSRNRTSSHTKRAVIIGLLLLLVGVGLPAFYLVSAYSGHQGEHPIGQKGPIAASTPKHAPQKKATPRATATATVCTAQMVAQPIPKVARAKVIKGQMTFTTTAACEGTIRLTLLADFSPPLEVRACISTACGTWQPLMQAGTTVTLLANIPTKTPYSLEFLVVLNRAPRTIKASLTG